MKKLIYLLYFGAIIVALALAVQRAVAITEAGECVGWLEDSRQIPDWFSTSWQVDQCHFYGIDLPKGLR